MTKNSPRPVFANIFAFPSNRATLGGTAYLILDKAEGRSVNILIDCPPLTDESLEFLEQRGGVTWMVITHRDGRGESRQIQERLGCPLVIQEQEAYLLPGCDVRPFQHELALTPLSQLIWTPGYSPGSACLHYGGHGGVLFSGRHLLPHRSTVLAPVKFAKTFHWPRQLQQVEALKQRWPAEQLSYVCSGASTGILRGNYAIAAAHQALQTLDLESLKQQVPLL